jgi:hypothetical protein
LTRDEPPGFTCSRFVSPRRHEAVAPVPFLSEQKDLFMITSLLSVCLSLAALGGFPDPPVTAKPADLPRSPLVDCEEQEPGRTQGGLRIGFNQYGMLLVQLCPAGERGEGCTAFTMPFAGCPGLVNLLDLASWVLTQYLAQYGLAEPFGESLDVDAGKAEVLEVLPARVAPTPLPPPDLVPGKPPTPVLPPDFTCPFLRQQASTKTGDAADVFDGTVLENLRKLEAARKLFRRAEAYRKAGQVGKACQCYESIHDLCPGSRYARMATERLQEARAALRAEADSAVSEEQETPPLPRDKPDDEVLRPVLPAVDPKIVDALERLLAEAGDPGTPRLVIHVDEPADDDEEDEPPAGWPLPAGFEVPVLFVDSVFEALTLDEELAGDEDDDEDEEDVPPFLDVNQLLRDVIETLRRTTGTPEGALESQPRQSSETFRAGAVEFTVESDDNGYNYIRLWLLPEESGDLRAAQRAQNDRIIHWIEALSGNGGCTVPEVENDGLLWDGDWDDDLPFDYVA